jgi:hypothetical protein
MFLSWFAKTSLGMFEYVFVRNAGPLWSVLVMSLPDFCIRIKLASQNEMN